MRRTFRLALASLLALPLVALAAQEPPATQPPETQPEQPKPKPKLPERFAGGVNKVKAHIVTMEMEALAPIVSGEGAGPEAQPLLDQFRGVRRVKTRLFVAGDVVRQEILSDDFLLPKGTIVLHKAGDRYFAIVDDAKKTFLPLDAETIISALEGGVGIENSRYEASVTHTPERRTIAGLPARKSLVEVTYVSSVPFENDRIMVQRKNDIEVWHTSDLPSAAAHDHVFFRYRRDRTGLVQQKIHEEIGFPVEVKLLVTQGSGAKAAEAQAGSFTMKVTEATTETVEDTIFEIPPKGYDRIDKNPYFKTAD